MLQTTLRQLHKAGACKDRYLFLAKNLGGIEKYGMDTPITVTQILDTNGLDDALWSLRACDDAEKFCRLLACDYAERALPIWEAEYPDDERPRKAIEVSRKYAIGEVTEEELDTARITAKAAAKYAFAVGESPAAFAAEHAAKAARGAVEHDPWYTARNAAGAVSIAAAGAAWHAADAAYAAAGYPKVDTVISPQAQASEHAQVAAKIAECKWQEKRLLEMLKEVE